MNGDVGRRGNEEREEAGSRAAEGRVGKKDRAISALSNTHLDEVDTSLANPVH